MWVLIVEVTFTLLDFSFNLVELELLRIGTHVSSIEEAHDEPSVHQVQVDIVPMGKSPVVGVSFKRTKHSMVHLIHVTEALGDDILRLDTG